MLPLFCPSSSAWQSEGFVIWLLSQGKTKATSKQTKNYAVKYGHVLDSGDASPLLILSDRNRQHAMVALANLAKYQGRYQDFTQIKQRYGLKWSTGNESVQALQRFFNSEMSLDHMLQRVREMMRVLPADMAAIVRHAVLTGLRPSEACESVRLLNSGYMSATIY